MRAPGAARVVLAVLACLSIGCAGEGGGEGGGGPKPPECTSQVPGDPISYQANIAPLLARSCGLAGCHLPPLVNAGLDLTPAKAYNQMVGVNSQQVPRLKRIKPGDPDNSYLIHKLEGRSDIIGVRMPRGNGPYLTDGQILVIKRWIANGAPNN